MPYGGSASLSGIKSKLQQSIEKVEIPPVERFVPPAVDTGRIERITQQFASPYISKNRRALTNALVLAQQAESPTERALLTREALGGFGGGVDEALARSRASAMSAYAPEYESMVEADRLSWSERMMRERYKYLASLEASTTDTGPHMGGGIPGRAIGRLPDSGPGRVSLPMLDSPWGSIHGPRGRWGVGSGGGQVSTPSTGGSGSTLSTLYPELSSGQVGPSEQLSPTYWDTRPGYNPY